MHKVAVITPSYNSADFISKTIESVLSQRYQNWEMIIVDDCSTDKSVEIIKSYQKKDPRLKLIELKENSGAAVARNTAIEAASAQYIAFLDSDDLWYPEKLEKQIGFMIENDVKFSYSAYDVINEEGTQVGVFNIPEKVNRTDLLKTCSIGCLTAIYDVSYFGKVYMPLLKRAQDYGLWLQLLKDIDYAYGVAEPLAKYRLRTLSVSSNKFKKAKYQWKVYREVERLGLFESMYYFVHYTYHGIKKYS